MLMASVNAAPTQEGGTSVAGAFITLIEDGLCDVLAFVARRKSHTELGLAEL